MTYSIFVLIRQFEGWKYESIHLKYFPLTLLLGLPKVTSRAFNRQKKL